MYKCVMGLSEVDGEGCILADDMGLGKTLQTIALIYTMLSKPILCYGVHVCPLSQSLTVIEQSPLKNRTSW